MEIIKQCRQCGKDFIAHTWEITHGKDKYCDKKCYSDWQSSSDNKGKNNPMWKGDDICYHSLHVWLNRNYKKSGICDLCGQEKVTEIALKKGKKYDRNIFNYFELCHYCHRNFDRGNMLFIKQSDITSAEKVAELLCIEGIIKDKKDTIKFFNRYLVRKKL